jgi:hypothetical protein
MIATYILGHLIEPALHNEARPRVTRALKLTERHIGWFVPSGFRTRRRKFLVT